MSYLITVTLLIPGQGWHSSKEEGDRARHSIKTTKISKTYPRVNRKWTIFPNVKTRIYNDRNLKTASRDMDLEKKSKNSRSVKYQVRLPKEFYSSRQKQRAARPRVGECRGKKNKTGIGFIRLIGVRQDSILCTNGLQGKPKIP